jgi:hypothetical protein
LTVTVFVDNLPPEIVNVLVNNAATVSVVAGTPVTLNATIDDEATGGTDIGGANYTMGTFNWPGTAMNPADGAFDNRVEGVTIGIDTTGWTIGSYVVCVYGWDIIPNYNMTSNECGVIDVVDLTPPTASGTPTGTGISIATNITVQFDEPMNIASVEASFSYTDLTTTWDITDGMPTWSNGDATLVFNPAADLGYNTTYMVDLDGSVATDVAGNLLDGNGDGTGGDDYSFSFKTEEQPSADTTPPTVVDTNPDDEDSDV